MKTRPLLAALLLAVALAGPAGAAPATPPAEATARPSWGWPLSPRPAVVRPFDPPPEPWLSGHRGVDLQAAADGVPVTSPADGVVGFVGTVVDRPVITIEHAGGLRSSFEPVRSPLHKGEQVRKGQEIGILEPGHCGPLPCVHWGVRRGDEYVDPLAFVMDLRPSVLLPLRSPP